VQPIPAEAHMVSQKPRGANIWESVYVQQREVSSSVVYPRAVLNILPGGGGRGGPDYFHVSIWT
jgi:hypothetical protein